MNRKENYANIEKWRETCRRQRRKYYDKTKAYSSISNGRSWSYEEDLKVMRHDMTDNELAAELKRSVCAIQKRRSRLKKACFLEKKIA